MDFLEQARVAADSIRINKTRSVLTTLGVVIGVTSVILLVSIGEGVRDYLSNIFTGMGSNLLFVFPGKQATHGGGPPVSRTVRKFTLEDARAIRQRSPHVISVAPMLMGGGSVEREGRSRDTLIIGTERDFMSVHNLSLTMGEFIREEDVDAKRRVAVIGKTVATEIFGDRSPLGQPVKLSESRYLVVGVMAPKGQSLGMDFDDVVFIPVTCAMDLFNEDGLSRISLKTANPNNLGPATEDVRRILKRRHNNREDFTIVNQADVFETFNQIATTMTYVLLAIASISLLVGGIGIMNIMLVSVRERTREIGLRKAVGARRRDILIQFLIESIAISLVGGLIGLCLGTLLALGISAAVPEFPTSITLWIVLVAFGFSAGVGVFFGVAPARMAANLDPIEALRYE